MTMEGGEINDGNQAGAGLDIIPEQFRQSSWATKYSTAEDFWNGVDNMSKMVGQKSFEVPGLDANDETLNKFFGQIGRPESFDAYQLDKVEMPEGYDLEGVTKEFRELVHAAGLNPIQAKKLFSGYMESQKGHFEKMNAPVEYDMEKIAKEAFPNNTEESFTLAKKGAQALGVADRLDQEGLSGNPLVLQLCAKLGELVGEDSFQSGNQGSDDKDSLMAQIKEIQMKPGYFNSSELQSQVEELFKKIYR